MGGMHVKARSADGRSSRGFTLIELMVVIVIIGVVVAIVFPALAGARNAARKAATTAMMTELATASTKFYTENNRQPGYFTPLEMGHADNLTRGFSAMENILLDLAGGIVENNAMLVAGNNNPCDDINGPQVFDVGPLNDNTRDVRVDVRLIGSAEIGNKAYWTPDKRSYVRQCTIEKQDAEANHRSLPDVVDAWGTPILAWVQDDPGAAENTRFALESYTPGGNAERARYYWASNAGFLKATALGKLSKNQDETGPAAEDGYSLIGANRNENKLYGSLEAFLGHPAYPDPNAPNPTPGTTATPKIGRAAIVFHSAGVDGYYLGSNDVGGKRAGTDRVIKYNPPAPVASPGAPIPRQPDPTDGFDDLIVNAGSSN